MMQKITEITRRSKKHRLQESKQIKKQQSSIKNQRMFFVELRCLVKNTQIKKRPQKLC